MNAILLLFLITVIGYIFDEPHVTWYVLGNYAKAHVLPCHPEAWVSQRYTTHENGVKLYHFTITYGKVCQPRVQDGVQAGCFAMKTSWNVYITLDKKFRKHRYGWEEKPCNSISDFGL